ncbi:MAG: hypothetical protein EP318_00945 [Rhodobacteraceae bacterium]|nr:MAG: hypothetical protein EP318_00945 [Paracoccaceae bacterium]
MKQLVVAAVIATLLAPLVANAVQAGPISRACLSSGRKAATFNLCNCIQSVADAALTRADQRLAARFFRDPHQAQEVRQSDRASHEAFWKRYKLFGAQAEAACRGY